MSKTAHIIYHGNCPDGFTGAWIIHRHLTLMPDKSEIVMHPATYGQAIPEGIRYEDDVYMVDFCYPANELLNLYRSCRYLTILDHHQTGLEYVTEVYGESVITKWDDTYLMKKNVVVLDQDHSGAMLAMLWAGHDYHFVKYVEDRDLWRFVYGDWTRQIFAAITSYEHTIKNWDRLATLLPHDLAGEGQAIDRYRARLIEQIVPDAYQTTVLGHDDIWVVQAPYAVASDVAGILAERDPERFAAYYIDKPNGGRKWGLRSVDPSGMDVAKLAETRPPGGGHKHAAGYDDIRSEP